MAFEAAIERARAVVQKEVEAVLAPDTAMTPADELSAAYFTGLGGLKTHGIRVAPEAGSGELITGSAPVDGDNISLGGDLVGLTGSRKGPTVSVRASFPDLRNQGRPLYEIIGQREGKPPKLVDSQTGRVVGEDQEEYPAAVRDVTDLIGRAIRVLDRRAGIRRPFLSKPSA